MALHIPKLPNRIAILGKTYSIIYCDNPADVDMYKREALWGQIDYWTRTIRIYDNKRSLEDIWHSIFHEILHAIGTELHLENFSKKENHNELDIIALALTDILFRNDLIQTT